MTSLSGSALADPACQYCILIFSSRSVSRVPMRHEINQKFVQIHRMAYVHHSTLKIPAPVSCLSFGTSSTLAAGSGAYLPLGAEQIRCSWNILQMMEQYDSTNYPPVESQKLSEGSYTTYPPFNGLKHLRTTKHPVSGSPVVRQYVYICIYEFMGIMM